MSAVLSFAAFYSCNVVNPQIRFVTSEVVYRVGDNIDFYDFIITESNTEYEFRVVDSESNSSEIFDRTMYASKAGEYTVFCTASSGKKSVTDSTTFNIYDTLPIMMISGETSYNYEMTLPMNDLVPLDLMFVKTETSVDYVIDYVTFFANSYVYNAYCIDENIELD